MYNIKYHHITVSQLPDDILLLLGIFPLTSFPPSLSAPLVTAVLSVCLPVLLAEINWTSCFTHLIIPSKLLYMITHPSNTLVT